MRRTKIVCTIGPASSSADALTSLIESGMNVARLNFSHGSREEHGETIDRIREISYRLERPVAVLQDLAGLKIRIGDLEAGSVTLEPEAEFILTTRDVPGDAHQVAVNYSRLPENVDVGDTLLLSDGEIELEVTEVRKDDIRCRVVVGGELTPNKGVNLPMSTIDASVLTEKDREDLAFGIERGVDFVAMSFVASAAHVREVRRVIQGYDAEIPVIAKVERNEALDNIDSILETADGIMVARGDLGVETPLQTIPRVQKMLIERANRASRMAITATHMLRSMVDNRRPTRAEVTDVANAVLDGSDAVMLSEETAIGQYPVEAVAMMSEIAADVETGFPYRQWLQKLIEQEDRGLAESVALAACRLAQDIGAVSILASTRSGATARYIAKHRPRQTIYAPTSCAETFRRLALVWGVTPLHCPGVDVNEEMFDKVLEKIRESGLAGGDGRVVVVGGAPGDSEGTTNAIRVVDSHQWSN